jgi:hypothetical protein
MSQMLAVQNDMGIQVALLRSACCLSRFRIGSGTFLNGQGRYACFA